MYCIDIRPDAKILATLLSTHKTPNGYKFPIIYCVEAVLPLTQTPELYQTPELL